MEFANTSMMAPPSTIFYYNLTDIIIIEENMRRENPHGKAVKTDINPLNAVSLHGI